MTDTVGATEASTESTASSNGQTKNRKARTTQGDRSNGSRGLHLERLYTTAGVHPYDEVSWQRRDVVMTNWRDGSINFEQRGVEFPGFWSINATNIVTSKSQNHCTSRTGSPSANVANAPAAPPVECRPGEGNART